MWRKSIRRILRENQEEIVALVDDLKTTVTAVVNVLNDLAAKAKSTGSVSDTEVQSAIDTLKQTVNIDDPNFQQPTTPTTP